MHTIGLHRESNFDRPLPQVIIQYHRIILQRNHMQQLLIWEVVSSQQFGGKGQALAGGIGIVTYYLNLIATNGMQIDLCHADICEMPHLEEFPATT